MPAAASHARRPGGHRRRRDHDRLRGDPQEYAGRPSAPCCPLGGLGEETGGYKGYGFTAIVEILSAALAGGPFMKELSGKDENGNNRMYRLGHFFFVINPEFFMGLDTFKKTAGDICRGLRRVQEGQGRPSTSIPPARRNILPGRSARTRVSPWANPSRRNLSPSATV